MLRSILLIAIVAALSGCEVTQEIPAENEQYSFVRPVHTNGGSDNKSSQDANSDEVARLRKEVADLREVIRIMNAGETQGQGRGYVAKESKSSPSKTSYWNTQQYQIKKPVEHNKVVISAGTPIDVVLRYQSKSQANNWMAKLTNAGVKNKFISAGSNNDWLIYVGRYSTLQDARVRKEYILSQTAANTIEIVAGSTRIE